MIEAQHMTDADLVFIGGSLYGRAGYADQGESIVLSHECPDGTIRQQVCAPWDEFIRAGEKLAELRGDLDDIEAQLRAEVHRTGRANQMRREMAFNRVRVLREKRARTQAQIAELEDLGVVASMTLGQPERCPECRGSGHPIENQDDVCHACAGSGTEQS